MKGSSVCWIQVYNVVVAGFFSICSTDNELDGTLKNTHRMIIRDSVCRRTASVRFCDDMRYMPGCWDVRYLR